MASLGEGSLWRLQDPCVPITGPEGPSLSPSGSWLCVGAPLRALPLSCSVPLEGEAYDSRPPHVV